MRKTTKRRIRTKQQIVSDFLTDLIKNKIVDLEGIPFENYLETNFDELLGLLMGKLYETEEHKGATISTLDAFYHFINYVVRVDPKSKVRIWNEFVKEIFLMIERNRMVCFMAPRQHGKSFITFVLYPIFKGFLVDGFEAILCSNTPQMTKNNFRNLKRIIDSNELLLERKAEELGRDLTWSEKEIEYNGGYTQTLSVGGTPRSGTFYYAVLDDPLRDDNKYPDDFYLNFVLGQLLPTISRNQGRLVVNGTPQSKIDLFHTLMKDHDDNPVFDGGYSKKGFYCKRFQAITDEKNKKVLVPEIFNYDQLTYERGIQGEIFFNREFMCKCIEDDTTLFPYSLIKKCTKTDLKTIFKGNPDSTYFIGCDIATSAEASADYSAFVVVEVKDLADGLRKTIRHIVHVKGMTVPEQIDTIQSLSRDFNNAFVLVEKNNVGVAIVQELQNRNVNVEAFTTDRPKKMSAIRFLSNEMRQGRLIFPDEGFEVGALKKELENFGVKLKRGKETMESLIGHDDLVDALWICNLATQEYGGSLPMAVVQD